MTAHVLPCRRLAGALAVLAGLTFLHAAEPSGERLTSRPRPAVANVKPTAVGEEVRTTIGQRRRLLLPDGSVAYVNADTTVKLTGDRRLRLDGGEVFVEVAPGKEDAAA